MMIGCIMWPVLCSQDFSMIWPTDLLFDLTWPIFKLDLDIVKMIILSKFDKNWTKSVASRVFTRFFYDLAYWPSFWPNMTCIRTWPRFHQCKHSDKFSWQLDAKNVACIVFTRFFYHLTYWPSFWPDMTHFQTWPRYCLDDHSEQVWWRLDKNCGL